MGLSSIALDIMLAALPEIGNAMKATTPNLAQLTVGTFLAGAAISAFAIGPVADAYGRRIPILAGLSLFVASSLLAPFAQNGALYGFIATTQPVYGEAFGLGMLFPFAMAATAIVQSGSAFVCSRLIRRFGAPAIGFSALSAYIVFAGMLVVMFSLGMLPFWLFFILVTSMMAMFTWADATLGALSMNNLGQVAGTAASAFGAIQAMGATLLGSLIGQGYDRTPRSLVWGVLILGLASLLSIAWAKRARMGAAYGKTGEWRE